MFNTKKIFSIICLFCVIVPGALFAEFQTFQSSSGASLEMELIELGRKGDTVSVRMRSGNKVNADLSAFSSADQTKIKNWWKEVQAAKQMLSPESRLDISAKMNRKSRDNNRNAGYSRTDDETKSFFPEVILKNSELDTFKGNSVRIVVVAKDLEDRDQRLIVSASTLKADFEERKETILESDPFKLRLYKYDSSYSNYNYERGYEYEGYIVIVKNSEGEVTHTRATKEKYLSNMKLIQECEAGQVYDDSLSRKLDVRPNSYYVK